MSHDLTSRISPESLLSRGAGISLTRVELHVSLQRDGGETRGSAELCGSDMIPALRHSSVMQENTQLNHSGS